MSPAIGIAGVAILLVTPVIGLSNTSNDDAAIRALQQQHEEAFRTHDAHLMATQFTDDADLVNVAGQWWRGRAEIEAKLSDLFATVFRNSAWTGNEVVSRYLKPDVAVVHVRWKMTVAVTPDGKPVPPRQGIATEVVEKRDVAAIWCPCSAS